MLKVQNRLFINTRKSVRRLWATPLSYTHVVKMVLGMCVSSVFINRFYESLNRVYARCFVGFLRGGLSFSQSSTRLFNELKG